MVHIFATIGAGLATALLLWIASSQLTVVTNQAVFKRDIEALTTTVAQSANQTKEALARQEHYLDTVWPRLRTHGENITLIKRELEALCRHNGLSDCAIELQDPERF